MHLEYQTLSAFADGEVGELSRAAVRAHLGTCSTCREEIRFIRKLGAALRKLPSPAAPQGFIDEIFPKEPGQGDVVPLFDRAPRISGASRSRWALPLVACLSGLLVGFLALTLGPDRVMAGSSTMTLERADAGTLAVEYETISSLSAEPALRARIRYWIPDSLRFTQTRAGFVAIELNRQDAGRFGGVAHLPPGTVYAMATVEDERGDRIDTNRGRFWEYIERDRKGQPTVRARLYQLLATEEFTPSRVGEVAELAVTEFPERADFWTPLLVFRHGTAANASDHTPSQTARARLNLLDSAARKGDPGPGEIHALSVLSRLLDREDLEASWQARLTSGHPRHEYASQTRLREIVFSSMTIGEKLDALDESWRIAPMPATAHVGLQFSYEAADHAITRVWLDRYTSESVLRDSRLDVEMVERMVSVTSLRPLAEEWILERLDHSLDWLGSDRPLDQTRSNFEAETVESRARLNLFLGRLRLARRDVPGGFKAMERAAALGWDPSSFLELARLHRTWGSVVRASEFLALAQSDPVVPLEPQLPGREDRQALDPTEDQMTFARAAWREHVMSSLLDEPVDLYAHIRTASGEETTLREAAGGGVTVVVHSWDTSAVPATSLALLHKNVPNLAAAGARALLITVDPDSPRETTSTPGKRPPSIPSYYVDERFEVWETLGAWRGVQYFVLDTNGTLRYRGEDAATALRIAIVLGKN